MGLYTSFCCCAPEGTDYTFRQLASFGTPDMDHQLSFVYRSIDRGTFPDEYYSGFAGHDEPFEVDGTQDRLVEVFYRFASWQDTVWVRQGTSGDSRLFAYSTSAELFSKPGADFTDPGTGLAFGDLMFANTQGIAVTWINFNTTVSTPGLGRTLYTFPLLATHASPAIYFRSTGAPLAFRDTDCQVFNVAHPTELGSGSMQVSDTGVPTFHSYPAGDTIYETEYQMPPDDTFPADVPVAFVPTRTIGEYRGAASTVKWELAENLGGGLFRYTETVRCLAGAIEYGVHDIAHIDVMTADVLFEVNVEWRDNSNVSGPLWNQYSFDFYGYEQDGQGNEAVLVYAGTIGGVAFQLSTDKPEGFYLAINGIQVHDNLRPDYEDDSVRYLVSPTWDGFLVTYLQRTTGGTTVHSWVRLYREAGMIWEHDLLPFNHDLGDHPLTYMGSDKVWCRLLNVPMSLPDGYPAAGLTYVAPPQFQAGDPPDVWYDWILRISDGALVPVREELNGQFRSIAHGEFYDMSRGYEACYADKANYPADFQPYLLPENPW